MAEISLRHERVTAVGVALGLVLSAASLAGGPANAATIIGTDGPDTLNGTPDADTIQAFGGNDTVDGRAGDDGIDGGSGRDLLLGGGGGDWIVGGLGNDQLSGAEGPDVLDGGAGKDALDGGADSDSLFGWDGPDTMLGRAGGDHVDGRAGPDVMSGGSGDDTLFAGDGNDELTGDAGADELLGGLGDDQLAGGAGADELEGAEGADRIAGGEGNDRLLYHETGVQVVTTFAVRDVVLDFEGAGLPGGDVFDLSFGKLLWVGRIGTRAKLGAFLPGGGDRITELGYVLRSNGSMLVADTDDSGSIGDGDFAIDLRGRLEPTPHDFANVTFVDAGSPGDDVIIGTEHDDWIFALAGDDEVHALGGNDRVDGGSGDDLLDGGPGGFDDLFGDEGADRLSLATSDLGGNADGGPGDDVLVASDTAPSFLHNSLRGERGNDDLYAGAVGASMDGGDGADRLFSGPGDDQFRLLRPGVDLDLEDEGDLLVYGGSGRWSSEGNLGDHVFVFRDGSDLFDLRGSGLQLSDLTIVNEDTQTTITSSRGTITIFESAGEEVFIDGDDFLF